VGVSGNRFVILTPDDDMYDEDFSSRNPDIDGFRLGPEGGGLPRGIDLAMSYRFRNYPDGQALRDLMREAKEIADAEAIRDDEGAAALPEGTWYVVEAGGGFSRGAIIELSDNAHVDGSVAIETRQYHGHEIKILCRRVVSANLSAFRENLGLSDEDDARVLPVQFKGGVRSRDFKDAVEKMSLSRFSDWRVDGPRTAEWCLRFLVRCGGPLAHHEWWKTTARLTLGDTGVGEHELIMKAVNDAVEYDQIDCMNLAVIEHCLRKAQMWEYYHRERTRQELSLSKMIKKNLVSILRSKAFFLVPTNRKGRLCCVLI
jgi:hypothetical protein